ncbi:hypothetical protein BDQ12DRAFT_53551 [Crucibulum laeve]|uniref:DUF6534 domain-containing protein n=1 Tax=Crucibulum laeve TaxID=68775 RepID=A0A5C3M1W4_9AGAR|nr:hypothetical protein BDQ12DRAFT_53551 [Crucibulum laeve]
MASDLDSTYGAMFIGLLFACFFQGVLSVQVYHYYENYPKDSIRVKLFVALLWILELAHLVLISHATYHYLVTNWGNPTALLYATQTLDLHLVFIGAATILCQSFFLHRIWIFSSRNIPLMVFLVLGCLSMLALDIVMTVIINRGDRSVALFNSFTPGVIAVFSISAGFDLILAGLLCFYLRNSTGNFDRMNTLVSRVIQYTVATGLLTSIVAVACLVAYLIRPTSFIFIAIHFSLGRMYTNALLATLNARQKLKESMMEHESLPPVFAAGILSKTHDDSDVLFSPKL